MAIKIFIDQGHNPRSFNTGAEGNGYTEQDITYAIGDLLAKNLCANTNFAVKLSRPSPNTVLGTNNSTSLSARVQSANAWGAQYFISLHTNSSENRNATGTEVLVYRTPSVATNFGEQVLLSLTQATGLTNRGVKVRPDLYVLRKTVMPAILVEMGFISNPSDAYLMATRPQLFADGIYQGILNYFNL